MKSLSFYCVESGLEDWKGTMKWTDLLEGYGMDLSDGNGIWRVGYILRMEIIKLGDGLDKVLKK